MLIKIIFYPCQKLQFIKTMESQLKQYVMLMSLSILPTIQTKDSLRWPLLPRLCAWSLGRRHRSCTRRCSCWSWCWCCLWSTGCSRCRSPCTRSHAVSPSSSPSSSPSCASLMTKQKLPLICVCYIRSCVMLPSMLCLNSSDTHQLSVSARLRGCW